jgi:hypothetical protein
MDSWSISLSFFARPQNQGLRFAAQDLGLKPIVAVQTDGVSVGWHFVADTVEPVGGFFQACVP